MNYSGQKVFVTGGTGFVGGRLVERLVLEQGARVRVLVRNWANAVWVSRLPVELCPGTMADSLALRRGVEGCSVVFHCASGGSTHSEYLHTNVDGTRYLLEAAAAAKAKRFVFVSSIAVHGPVPPDSASETADYSSWNRAYSRSKIEAELLVLKYGRERSLPVTIIRPTFVWGPRSGLFTTRPLKAMKDATFRLVDRGEGDCHAVYIDHLVDLLFAAGIRPEAVGEVFLATDGFKISWRQFFERYALWLNVGSLPTLSSRSPWVRLQSLLLEQTQRWLARWQGNPAPLWRRAGRRATYVIAQALQRRGIMNAWDLAKFARRGRLNASKAQRLLGHQSAWTFDEAMRETELWVRDQLGTELGLGEALPQT